MFRVQLLIAQDREQAFHSERIRDTWVNSLASCKPYFIWHSRVAPFHSFVRLFVRSFSQSVMHACMRSFIHSVSQSVSQSFVRSFIHSFKSWCGPAADVAFQYVLQFTSVGTNYYRLLAPINFPEFYKNVKKGKIMFGRSYDLKKAA